MSWRVFTAGLALAVNVLAADAVAPAKLAIRPSASVYGETPTLAHVLNVFESESQLHSLLRSQAIPAEPGTTTIVTYEQIMQRLSAVGLNPARVLLTGAAACRLSVAADPTPKQREQELNDKLPVQVPASERTLAQLLREHVNRELASLGGTVELEFDRASAPFLELTAPPWEFVIHAKGRQKLGLRELDVAIRREGRLHRAVDVAARVRLVKPVLVAKKPLNVGTFVEADAIELQERVFDREQDIGLERLEQALGHRVVRFVPAGQMVRAADLKAVELVQRSRPVTVLGAGPGVQVRLSGIALDNGCLNDVVRVRLGDSRRTQRVLAGVVTGPGTVRVSEKQP